MGAAAPFVAPAGTATLVGVVTPWTFDDRLTVVPPVGARPSSVTVPIDEVPPTTEVGSTETLVGTGGMTVKVVVTVEPCAFAVIVATVETATAEVAIEKVPEVAPAGTVTLVGGVAVVLLDDKPTTAPPVGAGRASVTVPVEVDPPGTDGGLTLSPVRNGVPIA